MPEEVAPSEAGVEVLYLTRPDTSVRIGHTGIVGEPGPAVIWWTDGINDWSETFPTVAVAMLRLGALFACEATGWVEGFTMEPIEFTAAAEAFLGSTIA